MLDGRFYAHFSALDSDAGTGKLHRHVLTIGTESVREALLADRAKKVGLGFIDFEPITETTRSRRNLANYLACNGMRYAIQHVHRSPHVRPFSRSGSWPRA